MKFVRLWRPFYAAPIRIALEAALLSMWEFRANDRHTVSNAVFGLLRISSSCRPRVGDGLPTIQPEPWAG
jgi:hypothetical protein